MAVFRGALASHQNPPPPCVQPCCRPLCYEQSERRLHKSLQMKMEEMSLSGLDNSKLEVRAAPRVPLVLSLGVSTPLYLAFTPKRNWGSQPGSLKGIASREGPRIRKKKGREVKMGKMAEESMIWGQGEWADVVGESCSQSRGL